MIGRNLSELETKAGDIRHRVGEEIYKTAEWYEKKVQTQLNTLTEKVLDQIGEPATRAGRRGFRGVYRRAGSFEPQLCRATRRTR